MLSTWGAKQGGGAAPPVVWLAASRPATGTTALSPGATFAGDSLQTGTGSSGAAANALYTLFDAYFTTGTVLGVAVSGMAYHLPAAGANTNPIPDQVAGQGSTGLNNYTQFHGTGVNGYNTGVVPMPDAQDWVATSLTGMASLAASLGGGATQLNIFMSGFGSDTTGPGMQHYASWRHLQTQTIAVYGAQVFDWRRYLMSQVSTDPTTLDNILTYKYWMKPLSFEGTSVGSTAFTNSHPTAWVAAVNTATNTAAGINTASPAASANDGDYIQNVSTTLNGGNTWVRCTDVTWAKSDPLHMSVPGYAAGVDMPINIALARQGSGAPYGAPAELRCAQDAASTTACGTIYYIGSAPDTIGLFDSSQVLVPTLTYVDNGSTNGKGSITVTRSGTGTLTEGRAIYDLQLKKGSLVSHSVVDLYVTRPSTRTAPRLMTLPNSSGSATAASDFSIMGRDKHGLVDGDKFGFAVWLNPSDLAANRAIFTFAANSGHLTDFTFRLSSTGQVVLLAHNEAGTLLLNTGGTAGIFAAGTKTWYAVDVDLSVSQPTVNGWRKTGAGANTAVATLGVAATGPTTMGLSWIVPRFFAVKDASMVTENYGATPDTARQQYRGDIGNVIVWNGSMGLAGNSAVADLIYDISTGAARSRTPYAAINGVTPVWDMWFDVGTALGGGDNYLNEPWFGTERGISGLTVAP